MPSDNNHIDDAELSVPKELILKAFDFINERTIIFENNSIIKVRSRALEFLEYQDELDLVGSTYNSVIGSNQLQTGSQSLISIKNSRGELLNVFVEVMEISLNKDKFQMINLLDIESYSKSLSELSNIERQLNALISHSPFYLGIINQENTLTFVNHVGEYYQNQNVIGEPVQNVIDQEYQVLVMKTIDRIRSTGKFEKITIKDLSGGIYILNMIPLDHEDIMILGEDITEKEHSKQMLNIKDNQYERLFEQIPIGIIIETYNGTIKKVNRTVEELSGYSENDWLDRILQLSFVK